VRLSPARQFVLAVIQTHGRRRGLIFADNVYSGGQVSAGQLRFLPFYIDQLALIWEDLALLGRVEAMARQDALTGVLNRRALEARLAEVQRRSLETREACAVLVIDLDRFKESDEASLLQGPRGAFLPKLALGLGQGSPLKPRENIFLGVQRIDPDDAAQVWHPCEAAHQEAPHTVIQGEHRSAFQCRGGKVCILADLLLLPWIGSELGELIRQERESLHRSADELLAAEHLTAPPLKGLVPRGVSPPFLVELRADPDTVTDVQDGLEGSQGLWRRRPIRVSTGARHIRVHDEHVGADLLHEGSFGSLS
jgi:hypothetical protein